MQSDYLTVDSDLYANWDPGQLKSFSRRRIELIVHGQLSRTCRPHQLRTDFELIVHFELITFDRTAESAGNFSSGNGLIANRLFVRSYCMHRCAKLPEKRIS